MIKIQTYLKMLNYYYPAAENSFSLSLNMNLKSFDLKDMWLLCINIKFSINSSLYISL